MFLAEQSGFHPGLVIVVVIINTALRVYNNKLGSVKYSCTKHIQKSEHAQLTSDRLITTLASHVMRRHIS